MPTLSLRSSSTSRYQSGTISTKDVESFQEKDGFARAANEVLIWFRGKLTKIRRCPRLSAPIAVRSPSIGLTSYSGHWSMKSQHPFYWTLPTIQKNEPKNNSILFEYSSEQPLTNKHHHYGNIPTGNRHRLASH